METWDKEDNTKRFRFYSFLLKTNDGNKIINTKKCMEKNGIY